MSTSEYNVGMVRTEITQAANYINHKRYNIPLILASEHMRFRTVAELGPMTVLLHKESELESEIFL